ncbi:MAG: hypothetical protein IJO64_06840 [Clostridia bacterium]|nr:hypothetical protein [Clostridia bacterium]
MKKFLLSSVCPVSIILTGCEIHFADGTRYEVPWWLSLIVISPILIASAFLIIVNMPKDFWAYCPKCKNRFFVKKRVFNFASHSQDYFEFVTKCPCCGEKTLCRRSYDQDKK